MCVPRLITTLEALYLSQNLVHGENQTQRQTHNPMVEENGIPTFWGLESSPSSQKTRATIGVPHFRSLRHVLFNPNTDLEKLKLLTGCKIPRPRYKTRIVQKQNGAFPTILGLRSPVIQKSSQTKSATSIVARVKK